MDEKEKKISIKEKILLSKEKKKLSIPEQILLSKEKKILRASEIENVINERVKIMGPKDREYFRSMFQDLVNNHTIPLEMVKLIPVVPREAGKTRFDQIYGAAMALLFPEYEKKTLERLLGPSFIPGIKIWRVLVPESYGIAHVMIRARTYQEAFALGCDYACRISLRLYRKLPVDLTLRVMFMSERSIRRYLDVKWNNRKNVRKKKKLVGREISNKQLNGARISALGHPSRDDYSIVHYSERQDLARILKSRGIVRKSLVESESFSKTLLSVEPSSDEIKGSIHIK